MRLVPHQEDGAALILQRARAGSILAEASVYSDRYHCDACAESDAATWAVARKDLCRRLKRNRKCLRRGRVTCRMRSSARLHAEILSLKTVEARLNAWIAWNGILPGKGQRRRIADEIGVSPEAFYRELARRRIV